MDYGVIMAGGAGTRLWPLSRGNKPKQLLRVLGGKSLLQLSYERLRGLLPPERIFVCTAASYAQAVLQNLPELPPDNLLGEPVGRDTAAAVGFPAAVLARMDKDAVAAFVTADHVIEPVDDYRKALKAAFDVVRNRPEALVTFGIVPTHGHTGLGYIQRGEELSPPTSPKSYRVHAFKEKPDKPTADRYVETGRYYWNSGMFVWRCDTVLEELKSFLPLTHAELTKIADAWQTPRRQEVLNASYPALQKISVDYAIMEPASQGRGKSHVVVVEMDLRWIDVGSWPALAETLEVDEHNNAISAPKTVLMDCDDNVVISEIPGHLISAIGVSDLIVVHTPDATLICPKTEAQRVKDLVAKVKEKYGEAFQ